MRYLASEIAQMMAAGGQLALPEAELFHIAFDSRRIRAAHHTLFFALQGKNRNGEDFLTDAYRKGVRNFVVPKHSAFSAADCNIFTVNHPLQALQTLATRHRNAFTGPVAGITGSNGKTVVKEWLYQLLQNDFSIARSPRSYNSAIGVAISLLGIEKWHNMALIEAGISEPGEMEVLESMIQPSLGIFTHLGSAHDSNFANRESKVAEKVKLFAHCDVLVYCKDEHLLDKEIQKLKTANPLLKTITWGKHERSNFQIVGKEMEGMGTRIRFIHRATDHHLFIPFFDQASAENAMTCLCTLAAFERWDPEHIQAFETLEPLENRMAFMEGKNGNYVVNDSYSNDPESLEVALDFMLRQQPDKPHMVVLSDFDQIAADKNGLYQNVAHLLKEKGTRNLIAIGPDLFASKSSFGDIPAEFFETTEAFLQSPALSQIRDTAILVKGARKFKLERVTDALRKQLQKTHLQIDLNALRNNYSYIRSQLRSSTKVMAMVKAFGYGSGSFEAARALQFAGVDYLAVAYADEGVELRKAGIQVPVMVMNTGISDIETLSQYNLEPVIFDHAGLQDFKHSGKTLNVHIEIDTGMHRLGFAPQIAGVFQNLPKHLNIASVFSHLAASEDPQHDDFTRAQIASFHEACKCIEEDCGHSFIKHILNTGGVLRFPNAQLDMVRLGIGLYGVDPRGESNVNLETVLQLKTTISQIKEIPAGDSVGYGRRGKSDAARRIAVLPIGYADGLWRAVGHGKGYAQINGSQAPYVGSICMDMCMCDVTHIDCQAGDEVEIFGNKPNIQELATWCQTIPYEILTSVSGRVRREYLGEN